MTNLKRRRGRPVGTHIRDDKALALVADQIIAADLSLKPSTAMRKVCSGGNWQGLSTDAIVARWLRKWRTAAPAALEAARQRRDARLRPVPVPAIQWPDNMLTMSDELRAALIGIAKLQQPVRQAMAEMAKSLAPTQKLIEQMRVNLPLSTITKEFQDQMAALTASFNMPELKALFERSNALKISDAIRIPPTSTRLH